jgi:hypothetical protein
MLGSQQMFALTVSSLGDDVGVLANKQRILNGVGLARSHNPLLQRERFRVVD